MGSTTAGFRIVTELGSGPTGEVFFAEHPDLGGRVALKLLRPEACLDATRLEAVLAEARAVGALDHPNLARVLGAGRVDDRAWIATEVVDGESLEERLERTGAIEPREAAEIAASIAEALSEAHELGPYLHRGLKPSNVFVHARSVKVTDFAVTSFLQELDLPLECLRYASPEQCRGDGDIDERTDVYSLGALLYQLLTGQPPFDLDEGERLVVAHTTEPPPAPGSLREGLPHWLERVVLRALEKPREARYPTARAMADALREGLAAPWADEGGALRDPEPPTRRDFVPVPGPTEDGPTDEMEVPPDAPAEKEPTGPIRLFDSSPPPLAERQRRAADKLSRVLVQRTVSGRLDLPPPPEGITAFVKLITETSGDVDALDVLESDEALSELLGKARAEAFSVARRAHQYASEVGEGADPCFAYLGALLLAVGRVLVAEELPDAETRLKEPDNKYVDESVRRDVIEACHREVSVTLCFAWQVPPEIARALPAAGRPSGVSAGDPLASALTAAVGEPTQAD